MMWGCDIARVNFVRIMANSSPIDHIYFLYKSLRVWSPYGGGIQVVDAQ